MAFDIAIECSTPSTAPTKFLFDAVDELSAKYLTENGLIPSNFAPLLYANY